MWPCSRRSCSRPAPISAAARAAAVSRAARLAFASAKAFSQTLPGKAPHDRDRGAEDALAALAEQLALAAAVTDLATSPLPKATWDVVCTTENERATAPLHFSAA